MHRDEVAAHAPANRSAMAYLPDERPEQLAKVMTAFVPALGILAACALMLTAVTG